MFTFMWSSPWESGKCSQNPQSHIWCYSQVATIPNDTTENYYNSQLLQLFHILKGIFKKHFLWLKGPIYLMYSQLHALGICVLSRKEMLARFWGTSPLRESDCCLLQPNDTLWLWEFQRLMYAIQNWYTSLISPYN